MSRSRNLSGVARNRGQPIIVVTSLQSRRLSHKDNTRTLQVGGSMALIAGRMALAEDRDAWRARFGGCRAGSETLAAPLPPEDQQVQSMPDVSPTKWHLAHVTWFFETFLLQPSLQDLAAFETQFGLLFNSYYEQVGERHP